MFTVRLGLEGEYGNRLMRYLERHLDKSIRLRHITHPGQWPDEASAEELIIMSRPFFKKMAAPGVGSLRDDNILWISDDEEGDGYCRFHPPEELKDMILRRTGFIPAKTGESSSEPEVCGIFSPVADSKLPALLRSCMKPKDLYLGMGDMKNSGFSFSDDHKGHMGDLCYYIHLRDTDIVSRIKELSVHSNGCDFVPSASVFLPLLELSAEDYQWLFEQLGSDDTFTCIYVGIGCGILCAKGMLSQFDRLILLCSKENISGCVCCEHILQSVRAGYGQFSGSCSIIYEESLDSSEP